MTGLAEKTVRRTIARLKKSGLVEVVKVGTGRESTRYFLPHLKRCIEEQQEKTSESNSGSPPSAIRLVKPGEEAKELGSNIEIHGVSYTVDELIEKEVSMKQRLGQCRSPAGLKSTLRRKAATAGIALNGELIIGTGPSEDAFDVGQAIGTRKLYTGLRPRWSS